jgi:2',3'-cyclic-nucleotide 2'-phosphodiesterase (5'-nucleotidase family)
METSYENKTKLSLITLCLSATLVAPISAKDVTIYYTNDLHAHVSPGKFQLSIKNAVGGFANIATIVNDAKKKAKMYFSLMRVIILLAHI